MFSRHEPKLYFTSPKFRLTQSLLFILETGSCCRFIRNLAISLTCLHDIELHYVQFCILNMAYSDTVCIGSLCLFLCLISIFWLSSSHVTRFLWGSRISEKLFHLSACCPHMLSAFYNLLLLYTLNNLSYVSFHTLLSFSHSLHLSLNHMNQCFAC